MNHKVVASSHSVRRSQQTPPTSDAASPQNSHRSPGIAQVGCGWRCRVGPQQGMWAPCCGAQQDGSAWNYPEPCGETTELWKIKRNQNVNAKVQSVFRLFFSDRKHFPKPARQYSNILSAVKQAVYIYIFIYCVYTPLSSDITTRQVSSVLLPR